jgi:anti-anti-sigma factor
MVANTMPAQQDLSKNVVDRIRVVQTTDTISALAVEGECDLMTAPSLAEIAQRVLAEGKNLIIDLSEVSFLDAATVRALLDADAAAQARGCELVVQLTRATMVERVLSITGADRRLAIAATRRGAMELMPAAA